jgi:hypothetical protein
MRLSGMLAAVLAAAACAASATAGTSASDPLNLVLQRSDFPAKSTWSRMRLPTMERTYAAAGLRARVAGYSAQIPRGSTELTLVSGDISAFASVAQARRAFSSFKTYPSYLRPVRVPSYGDEQVSLVQTSRTGDRVELRVRKGGVIWRLMVVGSGTVPLTRAQVLAATNTYAAKQKRRIGSG